MAFPTGWQRKCAVVIDDAQVGSGGVSDFTVLLTRDNLPDEMCSPTDANRAQADGGDIRFSSDAAGSTQLPLAIDNWEYDTTDAAGDADIRLHVLVSSIAGTGSGDTTIYAWYKGGGSETQPSPTDTYGSRNAWDSNHCSRWSLDEATTDTPPEYKDSIGLNHLTESGTGATSVTAKRGNGFDGNATGYAVSQWPGWVTPNNNAAVPFTNTGLAKIPGEDVLGVVNFDDDEIWEIDLTDGSSLATEFDIGSDGATVPQGLCWDSTDSRWVVVNDSASVLYRFQRNGTFDNSISYTGSGNGIAYDEDLDQYITFYSGDVLQWLNKSGVQQSTLTITGDAAGKAREGITYASSRGTLFLTSDTDDMVYEVSKSTGATVDSFRGPNDIEHPAWDEDNGILWVNGDGRFHTGPTLGAENVIYKLTPGGESVDWKSPYDDYTLEWWWKPDSVTTTAVPLCFFNAVATGNFYCEVQTRSSGIVRVYESDVTFVNTASSTIAVDTWYFCQLVYDSAAATLTLYIDDVQKSQATSAVFNCRSDFRVAVGGRTYDSTKHNGLIDEVRLHRAARSAAWRTTRYNNENAPDSFATAGTPAAAGGGGAARKGSLTLLGVGSG